MMKTLWGRRPLALVPTNKSCQCGGCSPLFFLLQLWLLFQQQSVYNNGGSRPYLGVFFLLFIVGSPLRAPSFGDVGDGHNGFLLMCFMNGGTNDKKEKGRKKNKGRGKGALCGGGSGWTHFLTLPFDMCFFFTLWVSMLN